MNFYDLYWQNRNARRNNSKARITAVPIKRNQYINKNNSKDKDNAIKYINKEIAKNTDINKDRFRFQ